MALTVGVTATTAGAQGRLDPPVVLPPPSHEIELDLDSGWVTNAGDAVTVVYSTEVAVPGARWLRVRFGDTVLGGDLANGNGSYLLITSQLDGAYQFLNAVSLSQWRDTSAFFNGDAVSVELYAYPGGGLNRVAISGAIAGDPPTESLCAGTDDRTPTDDPRVGRIPGCTGFLIDDAFHCALTAGHCVGINFNVMQFNVPLSDPDGSLNQAHPDDQYAIDFDSIQLLNGGVGNDWAYYGCFPNPNTNLTPFQAQGGFFTLGLNAGAPGDEIRINGFGRTDPPADPELNRTLKTSSGLLLEVNASMLFYEVDTTPGDSGAVVIDEASGEAVAVHTHGGCDTVPGNRGTRMDNAGLQAALANPLGVCSSVPAGDGDFDGDGDIDLIDYSAFQSCLTGPAGSTTAGCGPGDIDADGNIDLLDYRYLSGGFTGDCGTVITADLEDTDACLGDTVVFAVAASGADLEWAWTKNGAIIEGETNPTLVIAPVTFASLGEYRGYSISACSVAGSSPAILDLPNPPIFTGVPGDLMVCLGDSASFSVAVFGLGPFDYQWQLDGEDIPGATGADYVIASVAPVDLGVYTCVVTDRCGNSATSEEFPAELSLLLPVIVTQPTLAISCVGLSAEFSVEATGEAPISYQWLFEGFAIPGATEPTYHIDPVQEDDFGLYACEISDACGGSVMTQWVQLRLGEVVIDAQPVGGAFCIGDTVFLFAGLSGALTIQWFKDDVPIPDATSAFYVISNAQPQDGGAYYVHAASLCNDLTSESAQVTIVDCGPP